PFAPFSSTVKVERRTPSFSVKDQNRSRFRHAAQIKEVIALPERLFTGPLGCSLQDRNPIPDLVQHFHPPRCKLFGWEDVVEQRLREMLRTEHNEQQRCEEQMS